MIYLRYSISNIIRAHYRDIINSTVSLTIAFGAYFILLSLPSRPTVSHGASTHKLVQETAPPTHSYDAASLPPIVLGQEIDFGTGKDNRALISGWSAPEPGGLWSRRHDAAIGFSVRCNDCFVTDLLLQFMCKVFLPLGGHFQRIEFWIDGKKIDQVRISVPQSTFVVQLKGLKIRDSTAVVLSLRLPDAIKPQGDPRALAINLSSIRLMP